MGISINAVLVGQFILDKGTGIYTGIVVQQLGSEFTVLCVGQEMTEYAILVWLKETIKLMREHRRTDVQAADMVDRQVRASSLN